MTPDSKNPNAGLLDGQESEIERRLYNARHGLADEARGHNLAPRDDDGELLHAGGASWDDLPPVEGLEPSEEPTDVPEIQDPEEEPEKASCAVVVLFSADALERWARWHTEEGPNAVKILPRGFDRPSRPYGAAIGAQVAALVEGTEGFLLVERRLRAEWGLPPARDALPTVLSGMPTVLVLMAMPMFLAALDAELPRELFPPRVVAGIEIERTVLEGEEEAQKAIDAKWRAMYPDSWRR